MGVARARATRRRAPKPRRRPAGRAVALMRAAPVRSTSCGPVTTPCRSATHRQVRTMPSAQALPPLAFGRVAFDSATAEVIRRCMAFDPAARPTSRADLEAQVTADGDEITLESFAQAVPEDVGELDSRALGLK